MTLESILHYVSLGLEVLIVLLGLRMLVKKKRLLGAGLAFSFTLYILYNLFMMFDWGVPPLVKEGVFLTATAAIFLTVFYLDWRGEK